MNDMLYLHTTRTLALAEIRSVFLLRPGSWKGESMEGRNLRNP